MTVSIESGHQSKSYGSWRVIDAVVGELDYLTRVILFTSDAVEGAGLLNRSHSLPSV